MAGVGEESERRVVSGGSFPKRSKESALLSVGGMGRKTEGRREGGKEERRGGREEKKKKRKRRRKERKTQITPHTSHLLHTPPAMSWGIWGRLEWEPACFSPVSQDATNQVDGG